LLQIAGTHNNNSSCCATLVKPSDRMVRSKRKHGKEAQEAAEEAASDDGVASPQKRSKEAPKNIKMPASDVSFSKQIREQWRYSTSRLYVRKSSDEATALLILAKLFNGTVPRDGDFLVPLKQAASKFFYDKPNAAKKLVFEYGRVLSAYITNIKKQWTECKLPTLEADATYDDPWHIVVQHSRLAYPADVKTICMKVSTGVMRAKADAVVRFKEIYDVSFYVFQYFLLTFFVHHL